MKLIDALLILLITLMLAYDYFPAISNVVDIPPLVFIITFVVLVVSSLFVKRRRIEKRNEKMKDRKNKGKDSLNSTPNLIWQFAIGFYIVFLMVLFTLIGGESAVGLSLTNEVFWVVFIVWLFELTNRWRKRNKQEIA